MDAFKHSNNQCKIFSCPTFKGIPQNLIAIINIGKLAREKSNYLTFSFAESIRQAGMQDLPDTLCQAVMSVASKYNVHCFEQCLFCFLAVVKLTLGTHWQLQLQLQCWFRAMSVLLLGSCQINLGHTLAASGQNFRNIQCPADMH